MGVLKMFSHTHYVPILKWKMGEYQALDRLAPNVKDALTPLLEIPRVGFDHEAGRDRETVDAHLGDFGRRLKQKWQAHRCFVDLALVPATERMADGSHCLTAVFDFARQHGCSAIPVVRLASDPAFQAAVAAIVVTDRRGACLRITAEDLSRPALGTEITALARRIGLPLGEIDLVFDYGAPGHSSAATLARHLEADLRLVPWVNRWRTFTIAAGSYPASMAGIARPFAIVPRLEWQAYQTLIASLPSGARIPTFGDYAVAHPEAPELDMRIIKPFAKLRYTITDSWHIAVGQPVRSHGFQQYHQLCADVVAQTYFDGASFSAGDAYIDGCAGGAVSNGNLSTWVWVGTNRHLTKVVSDLASLHALSIAAE